MKTTFSALSIPKKGTVVLLAGKDDALGTIARGLDDASGGTVSRAMKAADFSAKQGSFIEVLAPANLELDRIIVAGISSDEDLSSHDWERLAAVSLASLPQPNRMP